VKTLKTNPPHSPPPTPPPPTHSCACVRPGNTNPYIWAAWGYLEYRAGDVSRARKLFDAAIVVDETHAAAWHKWGMLEMRQGNFLRAR
jgi:tetratricopeptide (TPR) repeat protein